MKRSQRIQSIVNIKAEQEATALKALGVQQRNVQAAVAQLANLEKYRLEYLQTYSGNAHNRVQGLLAFRAFIAQLDVAITAQADIVQQAESALLRQRQHWEVLHQNTQNLQKVCQGLVQSEIKLESRREQIESDDRVSRSGLGSSFGMENA